LKWWNKLLLGLAALVVALALLVWLAPARWLAPMVQARLRGVQLHEVSGSVWNGRVGEVVMPDGTVLGRFHWQLSRRALLGRVFLHAALDGPFLRGQGEFSRVGDESAWRAVELRLALDALPQPPSTPWGSPRGELALDLAQLRVRNGWPDSVSGHLRWRRAAVQGPDEAVALGELVADLGGSHGVIRADLHDAGDGPLQLAGLAQLSPIGWRLDARLSPREPTPALQRWLARLGPPDAQGAVHLQRGAGLGALSTGASR